MGWVKGPLKAGRQTLDLGHRAAVLGLGISNQSLISHLADQGIEIWVYDQKCAGELKNRWAQVSRLVHRAFLGEKYLDEFVQHSRTTGFDWVFVTPGMPKDLPEIEQAASHGSVISSELPLFMLQCPATKIGITGSSGKTTTTTMLGEMLKHSQDENVWVGGNIGTTLIDKITDIEPEDLVVLEISSFQLELAELTPSFAAMLNISPNHLDVHGTMESYINAKSKLLKCQPYNGFALLNWDCEITRSLSTMTKTEPAFFSMYRTPQDWSCNETEGYLAGWICEDLLWVRPRGRERIRLCSVDEIPLRGPHNVANTLTAGILAIQMGCEPRRVIEAIKTFSPVSHRLEEVAERNGVLFVNDSIATSPDRTIAALNSFSEPVVLILGGYDKGISFSKLGEVVVDKAGKNQVAAVVLTGSTAGKIEEELGAAADVEGQKLKWTHTRVESETEVPLLSAGTFEDAFRSAVELSRCGEVVLLSPACASYDEFDNFRQRGRIFRELARDL